jgi:uncharacterized protein (TIGR03067 family)
MARLCGLLKCGSPGTAAVLACLVGVAFTAEPGLGLGEGVDATARGAPARGELAALDGTWLLESVEINGNKQGAPADGPSLEVRIKAGRLTVGQDNGAEGFTFTIDPSCTPKLIDLTEVEEGKGAGRGQTLEGIYEIKGDRLRLCLKEAAGVRERPTAFEARAGSQTILLTLRRQT